MMDGGMTGWMDDRWMDDSWQDDRMGEGVARKMIEECEQMITGWIDGWMGK